MMLPPLAASTPPTLAWLVEAPANPHLLTLHARIEWTHAMSERYTPDRRPPAPSWLSRLLAVEGIVQLTVLRHHLRLRKEREATWEALLPRLRAALDHPDTWELCDADTLRDDLRRTWTLPPSCHTKTRLVVEGVDAAAAHPLAQALVAFPGLTTVVLDGDTLTAKRSPVYQWDELTPRIEAALASV